LDAENVVVGREHTESGLLSTGARLDSDLGIVNTREVAGASWLVFFWLERERVRVDTWRWGTGVVNEWLHLVEVLTRLLFESVLTIENQTEGINSTVDVFAEGVGGTVNRKHWRTGEGGGDEAVGFDRESGNVRGNSWRRVGGVPGVGTVIQAEDEFLHWVVVRKPLLDFRTGGDGVSTGVLDLLDEVFVALLREATTFLGVEVNVVRPDLEYGTVGDGREGARQIEVETNFVVLEGNQRQRQTWVAIEEKDQGQENLIVSTDRSSHLTVVRFLGLVQVKLGVQTPPLLVVLVDALTTDGQFNILDSTLREPRVVASSAGTSLEFDVHVGDQITVTGDGHGNAAIVTWGTVDGLFDVFHSEVGVTLVHRLEESNFWVTRKIDILGTVRDELHETTGHCEFFVLYTEKIILRKNSV
jgi:hypothetical protein